jgi:voltage-gated potassium channel
MNGSSLADLQLGPRTGALVLLIVPPRPRGTGATRLYRGALYSPAEPELIANPSSDTRLAPGQRLVVMGSQRQLEAFGRLLGPALKSVDVMPN